MKHETYVRQLINRVHYREGRKLSIAEACRFVGVLYRYFRRFHGYKNALAEAEYLNSRYHWGNLRFANMAANSLAYTLRNTFPPAPQELITEVLWRIARKRCRFV